MGHRRITFEGSRGVILSGQLDLPTGTAPRAFALFAHCFTCGMNLKGASAITRGLTQKGIAVLRFDFTGLGASEGEFADSTFSSNVGDLVAAAKFLENEYSAPNILIGHSLGGAAAIVAAHDIPSVRAVATIGAPADPQHVTHLFDMDKVETEGAAEVDIGGRPFTVKREFLEDLASIPMKERIGSLKRALLILHAPKDDIVGIDNARGIFEAAKHPKSFISLDEADHLLTRQRDAQYVADVIASWAGQYLPEVTLEPTNKLTVNIGSEGFLSTVQIGNHHLLADEPNSYGGTDLGPTPYDYLSAALGTCTAMTLRMYANKKRWPLEGVSVVVDHQKVHKQDCEDCDGQGAKIDQFERSIALKGDLDEAQQKRLIEIADRCPVHKTLSTESSIVTKSLPEI